MVSDKFYLFGIGKNNSNKLPGMCFFNANILCLVSLFSYHFHVCFDKSIGLFKNNIELHF